MDNTDLAESVENEFEYLESSDLYYDIIENGLYDAKHEVLIATANLKDVRVRYKKKFVSIVKIFSELVSKGVAIKLLHASNPSKAYIRSLRGTVLERQKNFQRIQCPRIHFKTIIVDKSWMYLGSANLTGAGLGFKSEENRNFEIGFKITDERMIQNVYTYFNFIWNGEMCTDCGRRSVCPKPIK